MGVVAERVHVEPVTDADHRCGPSSASATARSWRWVIFTLAGDPGTTTTLPPAGLDQRAVVGGVATGRMGGAQRFGAERLRRLDGDQLGPVHGGDDRVARPPA